jgi:hypothetical protein
MDCHRGGLLVEVMAPFVDKGWGWLNGARQYDDRWCDWMVAEFGGSEIELWNWGFNVAEWLNDDFIFCTSNPFFERRLLIFFSIISIFFSIIFICSSVFLIKPSIIA